MINHYVRLRRRVGAFIWMHVDLTQRQKSSCMCFGIFSGLLREGHGEGYFVGCNLQPHHYRKRNVTHWTFKFKYNSLARLELELGWLYFSKPPNRDP